MNRFSIFITVFALFFSAYAFAETATWKIDADHTSAHFSIQHMVIAKVRGSFAGIQGKVTADENNLTAAVVEATIPVATINTNNARRDEHLRSADFFHAEKYPEMIFKSKKVTFGAAENTLNVVGDLTLHGVTREVELLVSGPTPAVTDPWGNTRRGAQATTIINRKDFGLAWNKALETGGLLVGEEVDIVIDVELVREKN
ncbi:MAG: YceI family protein [Deltaproteobacteria bacterium]|nr:YceI family protein [Deltaproteobacteria bacterium]